MYMYVNNIQTVRTAMFKLALINKACACINTTTHTVRHIILIAFACKYEYAYQYKYKYKHKYKT